LIRRLEGAVALRLTFAVETTLSSRNYVPRLREWSAAGYITTLHFIELPSADYAVSRVARRVAAGGHAVAEVDVRRRFERGLQLFSSTYKPLVDRWYHWRSDDRGLRLDDHSRKHPARP
jgi:predicted ABC-type ATPase